MLRELIDTRRYKNPQKLNETVTCLFHRIYMFQHFVFVEHLLHALGLVLNSRIEGSKFKALNLTVFKAG